MFLEGRCPRPPPRLVAGKANRRASGQSTAIGAIIRRFFLFCACSCARRQASNRPRVSFLPVAAPTSSQTFTLRRLHLTDSRGNSVARIHISRIEPVVSRSFHTGEHSTAYRCPLFLPLASCGGAGFGEAVFQLSRTTCRSRCRRDQINHRVAQRRNSVHPCLDAGSSDQFRPFARVAFAGEFASWRVEAHVDPGRRLSARDRARLSVS